MFAGLMGSASGDFRSRCAIKVPPDRVSTAQEAPSLSCEPDTAGERALFWLHDTTVMGWQQRDEPALVDY
jgi:hypothetical protein